MTGTNTYSAADLAAVIPEIWGGPFLEAFFAKPVAANFFRDLSEMIPEGDTLNLPDIFTNVLASGSKSNGSEVTLNSPAATAVQLSVSTWRYVAYLIEDKELRQMAKVFATLDELAKQAGKVLGDDLDDTLLALWSGLSQSVGTTSAAITDLQIRGCVRRLDAANVPKDDRAWFFHPTPYWDQIAAISKYYDASIRGKMPGLTFDGNLGAFDESRGLMGVLYGAPIFITTNVVNNLTAYRNIYAHRDAFGFAVQTPGMNADGSNPVRMQSDYILENLGVLTVADILYGATELRDDSGVVLNGSTTATTA